MHQDFLQSSGNGADDWDNDGSGEANAARAGVNGFVENGAGNSADFESEADRKRRIRNARRREQRAAKRKQAKLEKQMMIQTMRDQEMAKKNHGMAPTTTMMTTTPSAMMMRTISTTTTTTTGMVPPVKALSNAASKSPAMTMTTTSGLAASSGAGSGKSISGGGGGGGAGFLKEGDVTSKDSAGFKSSTVAPLNRYEPRNVNAVQVQSELFRCVFTFL